MMPFTTMSKSPWVALLFAIVLFLSISATSSKSCPPAFRDKCQCGNIKYELDKSPEYAVNCTNTNFKDTSMLEHLPVETEVLIFTGNNITELPWNVFGSVINYTKLRVIDMSNNNIRDIRGKSFHHVANVQRLILNHNNLTIASSDKFGHSHNHPRIFSNFVSLQELHLTNAFEDNTPEQLASDLHNIFVNSNLTNLIKLHLEQNEISSFEDRSVFCELPSLMDLHLGNNHLRGIDFNIPCLPHLRFLDLEQNWISALSDKDLSTLDMLPDRKQTLTIDLMGNPFSCDCAIQDLYKWLQTTKVMVRNKEFLRCNRGYPEDNGGKSVTTLQEIQCFPKVTSSAAGSAHQASTVVLTVLLVVLATLLVIVVYINRVHIKHHFTPLLNTVSQKVQYTSIGKHEEQEMNV